MQISVHRAQMMSLRRPVAWTAFTNPMSSQELAYIAGIEASSREALASIDPVPFCVAGGENFWAGVKGHLDAVTERVAAPVIAKYTGVLAAADVEVFTYTTTFQIMQSLRLDRGPSGPVHP